MRIVHRLAAVLVVGVLLLVAKSYLPPLFPLSCAKAINVSDAKKIWEDNQETVREIRSLQDSAGNVIIELNTEKCKDKAFVHVMYDTESMRKKIHSILQASPLKKIPVDQQNI